MGERDEYLAILEALATVMDRIEALDPGPRRGHRYEMALWWLNQVGEDLLEAFGLTEACDEEPCV